ncbi:kinesin, partial [Helicosporidium sp. ATCC 50920]
GRRTTSLWTCAATCASSAGCGRPIPARRGRWRTAPRWCWPPTERSIRFPSTGCSSPRSRRERCLRRWRISCRARWTATRCASSATDRPARARRTPCREGPVPRRRASFPGRSSGSCSAPAKQSPRAGSTGWRPATSRFTTRPFATCWRSPPAPPTPGACPTPTPSSTAAGAGTPRSRAP